MAGLWGKLRVGQGASSADEGNTELYRNQGDGTFVVATNAGSIAATWIDTSAYAVATGRGGKFTDAVAWLDYDGDGDVDAIITNSANQNSVHRNDVSAGGTFVSVSAGSLTTTARNFIKGIACGYLNQDALPDCVFATYSGANELHLNTPGRNAGTFRRIMTTSISQGTALSTSVALGDYDGDGDIDVFFTVSGIDELHQNDGFAGFTKILTAAIVTPTHNSLFAAWADVDNDGRLDLAVAPESSGGGASVKLYRNDGGGMHVSAGFTSVNHANFSTRSKMMAIGDYNNDGLIDVVVAACAGTGCMQAEENGPPALNELHRGEGGGVFALVTGTSISAGPKYTRCVAFGDFDGDGFDDLLAGMMAAPSELHQNVRGITFVLVSVGTAIADFPGYLIVSCALVDWDQDGDLDIYFGSTSADHPSKNRMLRNTGGGLGSSFEEVFDSPIVNTSESKPAFAFADIDNDNDLDLVLAGYTSTVLSATSLQFINELYINDGRGGFVLDRTNSSLNQCDPVLSASSGGTMTNTLPACNAQGANAYAWGDFDGDGFVDLAVAVNQDSNQIHKNMGGTGNFNLITRNPSVPNSFSSASSESHAVAVGDYDGDGRLDLLVGNRPGSNELHRNLGGGSFGLVTGSSISTSACETFGVYFADVDNDGDLDVLVPQFDASNELHIFEHCARTALFGVSEACVSIPPYARRAINTDQAFECPQHWTGSVEPTVCQYCPPGFERPLGESACSKCPTGLAQSDGEGTACLGKHAASPTLPDSCCAHSPCVRFFLWRRVYGGQVLLVQWLGHVL